MAIRLPMDMQKRLAALGLVPPNCSNVELFIPAVGGMVLKYEVYVTEEHIAQFAQFFASYVESNKARTKPEAVS